MNLAGLSRQYALVESSVACSQYRSVIPAELGGDTQSRRDQIPRVEWAKAACDFPCLTPFEVDRWKVRTDGTAVVEPDAGIEGQSPSYDYSVGHEQGRADELAAIDRRSP